MKAKLKKQKKKEKREKKRKEKLKKKEEKKKAEVVLLPPSPPVEKPPSYLEVWQSDEGAVELGPGATLTYFTLSLSRLSRPSRVL